MTVVSVVKDEKARTMTVTAHFDASIEQVWRVWDDPRKLQRWWGPPSYPATVTEHNLVPGGTVAYFMTDADGERSFGSWRVLDVEAPFRLEFEDVFVGADGKPRTDTPTGLVRVTLSELAGGRTQMIIVMSWTSDEAMAQILAMGVDAGVTLGVGQIDELLDLPG